MSPTREAESVPAVSRARALGPTYAFGFVQRLAATKKCAGVGLCVPIPVAVAVVAASRPNGEDEPTSAMAEPPKILIADDQIDILQALRLLLKGESWEVKAAQSPAEVVATVRANDFDAVLIDLNYSRDTTSGREGMDLLSMLQELDETLPVVVMTAWSSVEGAVEAMRRGARDYIEKPWANERLLLTLRNQVDYARAVRRSRRLEQQNERLALTDAPLLIAYSAQMKRVADLIERVAPFDATVLITGEHGTGKEVVARRLHALSRRAAAPLIPVNAGALADGVFESEFFGHERGAFTDAKSARAGCFELADGGTLFLDEIGTMPMGQQSKILRVLQTGEVQRVGSSRVKRVDVRLIAATNASLPDEVAMGNFREDLLYRINTVEIPMPPLRQRREDVKPLAELFLSAAVARHGRPPLRFSADAIRALESHRWPGNVRELEHAAERAVLFARSEEVTPSDLGLDSSAARVPGSQSLEEMPLEEVERHLIVRALERHHGSVSDAARHLGMSRSALYRRMDRYKLSADR
jgi:DNA-binding NtrC family response regulator